MTKTKVDCDIAYRNYVDNIQALSNILEGRPEPAYVKHQNVEVRRCLARKGFYLKELARDPDESVRRIAESALNGPA
ncbi:hypothetical protein A9Q99_11870 [Gammaproteobacteria bacterium 45_16_T64]|nr:hypothetical protein A9Q99_11870 [Gammaproteobacteria bacterium 45_16_T64]